MPQVGYNNIGDEGAQAPKGLVSLTSLDLGGTASRTSLLMTAHGRHGDDGAGDRRRHAGGKGRSGVVLTA